MYNLEVYLISIILKATSYINDAIIFNQLNIMLPDVDIIGLCHSVEILR